MSDPHGAHAHDSHGKDAHGHDAHGHDPHGGGHGHGDEPRQTHVGPFEPTPWMAIGVGILVTAAVVLLGVAGKWNDSIKNNPNSKLGPIGQPATVR